MTLEQLNWLVDQRYLTDVNLYTTVKNDLSNWNIDKLVNGQLITQICAKEDFEKHFPSDAPVVED